MNFYAVALWVVFSATCVGAAHPGQCPSVDRDVGGICVEECSSDADCLSYQKCCSNGCGHACTIVKQPRIGLKLRPRCPPVDDDTIGPCLEECSSDDQCEVGKLCCSNGCGHACTAPMETPAKPGRCPAGEELQSTVGICSEECRTDGDCEGDMKCCSNGCGHTCTQPVRTNTTKSGQCPRVPLDSFGTCSENCTSDGDCPGKQKCCSNGCGHACAGPSQPKEGTCPKVPEDSAGICSEDCSSDADCLGQKKCCSNGCGHACRDPAPTAPKPGYCPVIQTGSVGICNEDCIADADCPGSQRCCSNGCGHVCMEPVEEKANNSGHCPRVDSEVGGICLEECSSDNECENAQRCCSNGCGHVCMDTTTEIQQETGCRLGENYYRDGEQVFTSEECTICYCRVGELKCKIVDGCQRETTIYMAIIIPVILTAVGIIISLSLLIVIVRCFILRKPSRRLRYKLMHEVPEFEPVPGAATRNDGYTL